MLGGLEYSTISIGDKLSAIRQVSLVISLLPSSALILYEDTIGSIGLNVTSTINLCSGQNSEVPNSLTTATTSEGNNTSDDTYLIKTCSHRE